MGLRIPSDDLANWYAALGELPETKTELRNWLLGPVHRFMAFQRVLLIHAELLAGQVQISHLLGLGYADQNLQAFSGSFDVEHRGCICWWLQHREPFVLDAERPPAFATRCELDEIRQYELGRIAAHGVVSASGLTGTYFSFSGLAPKAESWHEDALRLIAPVLNDLFIRLVVADQGQGPLEEMKTLTARQRQIIRLLAAGQCSKTIARELSISEKTVRNQLTEIYEKLGVENDRQLLAHLHRKTKAGSRDTQDGTFVPVQEAQPLPRIAAGSMSTSEQQVAIAPQHQPQ